MAKCSFGKVSLKGCFHTYWPFGTDIYARLFYVNANDTEVLIAAMDTSDTFPKDTVRFREMVSKKSGIPADNIWYHELQLHAAPNSVCLTGEYMERIADAVATETLSMKNRAVEFTCEVAEAYAGMKYTVNREQYVAGLGGVTVWSGIDYDENDKGYGNKWERMLLRGYHPDLDALKKPVPFDNPVDPRAYLFVFRNEDLQVIGTMTRFAAHPDVAVLFELEGVSDQYHYDYDWPGYLSDIMEKEFAAPSLYINGPCANLSTHKHYEGRNTYEKSKAECIRIANDFADLLLTRYKTKTVPFGNENNCKSAHFEFYLPMREDFPHSAAEAKDFEAVIDAAEEALQKAIRENAPAYVVKQLIDDRWRVHMTHRYIDEVGGFTDEDLQRRSIKVEVKVLQLGDYLFIGVPGESLVELTEFLRSNFTGIKTVTVDQCGGYLGYMATPTSLTLGGYTYWHSWVSRDAIPLLKDKIVEAMEDFLA